MICIQNKNGEVVKWFDMDQGSVLFHKQLGFVTSRALLNRLQMRVQSGLKKRDLLSQVLFSFDVDSQGDGLKLNNSYNCSVQNVDNKWKLINPWNEYYISTQAGGRVAMGLPATHQEDDKTFFKIMAVMILLALLFMTYVLKGPAVVEVAKEIPPEVILQVQEIPKKVIPIEQPKPVERMVDNHQAIDKNQKVKKALTQNLGFLKLLGRKDLKGAMGGLPTPNIKEATAGAGPGGKEGSGGEMLAGLGEGLRKTTVGNTGYAGLGGVGTKGAGGGLGGYGETSYASGAGQRISAMPLANEATIEGGLDRSLIQATIMRYLSQVRACYEEGLKRRPEIIGQVTMDFEINGTGGINFANVKKSSLGDKEVESCISMRMKTWKFPTPKGGVDVKVTYPFMLRPVKS